MIVSAISHKGGSGRTSLVQNMGYELTQTGKRVLLVDFDPQANLTIGCGLDPGTDRNTVYNAMNEPNETADIIVQLPYYHILTSNLDLAFAEQQFAGFYDRNDKLKDALKTVWKDYDYILIDPPPNLGFFAFNALTASTIAIVPLQCQPYAYRMLDSVLKMVKLVQKTNDRLTIKAVVLTMYDRRVKLTTSVEEAARERLGALVPHTTIPTNISIAEATLDGIPVAQYDATSAGANAYKELTKELFDNG